MVGVQTTKTLQPYLDVFNVHSGGLMQNLGIEPGEANDKAKAVGLDVYTQMLEEANRNKILQNAMKSMLNPSLVGR